MAAIHLDGVAHLYPPKLFHFYINGRTEHVQQRHFPLQNMTI